MASYVVKCWRCYRSDRKKRLRPYGSQKGKYWCLGCDANHVSDYVDKNRKKTARQEKNREIQNARRIANSKTGLE